MSSKDVAVSVRGLSKAYTIAHNLPKHTTAGEAFVHKLKHPFQRAETETFWALKDVSFDVKKGDVVGIIGRNGAGKSTLLKILSQITEPTSGEVRLYGRVGSLLEVGTGFHPELTGRENIFLNGAILGMRRKEIERQFDAIVDFAEVEQFLDTPVKRYSSGMYVRLAFAVAAHLNPEILVVDEVLSVGDAEFQRKCIGKMQDVSRQDGRTILFVSHNLAAVRSLCTHGVLLSGGEVKFAGDADTTVGHYLAGKRSVQVELPELNGVRVLQFSLIDVDTEKETFQPVAYRDYELCLKIQFDKPATRLAVSLMIKDDNDNTVSSICTPEEGIGWRSALKEISISYALDKLPLFPGEYWIDMEVYTGDKSSVFPRLCSFEIQPSVLPMADCAYRRYHGYFRLATSGRVWVDEQPAHKDFKVFA